MSEEDPNLNRVTLARVAMTAARARADVAAANYREAVRAAVRHWKETERLSLRKSADRLAITEGALRDLLRAPGQSRRAPKRHREP